MKITFLILAHNESEQIIKMASNIVSQGQSVLVHFDASSSVDELERIRDAFEKLGERAHVESSVSCGWGKWSLVEAPMNCLRTIKSLGWEPDFVHLMSAAERPIKPLWYLENFLEQHADFDFIESVDITRTKWVQGGLEMDRFTYYYPYSFIDQPRKFEAFLRFQRIIGINRKIPMGLKPRMGSQWWTLRWSTCSKILEYCGSHPEVEKYFSKTWIPDESFFQTLVAALVPDKEVSGVQLVFHLLGPNGRPFLFKNGHEPMVSRLPHFSIRKVSPEAGELEFFIENHVDSFSGSVDTVSTRSLLDAQKQVRAELLAQCEFENEAIWKPNRRPLAHSKQRVLVILHNEEEGQEVEEIINEYPDKIVYLGRPFSRNKEEYSRFYESFEKPVQPSDDYFEQQFSAVIDSYSGKIVAFSVVADRDTEAAEFDFSKIRFSNSIVIINSSILKEGFSKTTDLNLILLYMNIKIFSKEIKLLCNK